MCQNDWIGLLDWSKREVNWSQLSSGLQMCCSFELYKKNLKLEGHLSTPELGVTLNQVSLFFRQLKNLTNNRSGY